MVSEPGSPQVAEPPSRRQAQCPGLATLSLRVAFPLLFLGAGLVLVQPCAGDSGVFQATGSLATGRAFYTATMLPNGKVLAAGGATTGTGGSLQSAELYDPASGEQVLIAGFIITGTDSKQVIIRGMGPSLNGVGVTLSDPALELHQGSTTLSTNDNWKTNDQTGQSQQTEIEATTIAPTDDLESALVANLAPGNYTAIVRGKSNTTGVGLVEAYNLQ